MSEKLKTSGEFDVSYTDLSLTELKEQHPDELKEWCFNASGNGDSDIDRTNEHYCKIHFQDGSRADTIWSEKNFNGRDIGDGPHLQAEDFLHAMQEKNPNNEVLAFKRTKEVDGKEGVEYYFITDADFDTLNLPDGYGLRAGGPEEYDYWSSCQEDETGVGDVICHQETFRLSQKTSENNRSHFETTGPNIFKSAGETEGTKDQKGQEFPEQFRIIVKKQDSNKNPWL